MIFCYNENMKKVAISSKSGSRTHRLVLAKWLYRCANMISVVEALKASDSILDGHSLEIEQSRLNISEPLLDFISIDSIPEEDLEKKWYAEVMRHRELLERGANGDVESALEYCRLNYSGKIFRGPFC